MKLRSLMLGVAMCCSSVTFAQDGDGPPSPEQIQQMVAEMAGIQTEAFVYKNVKLVDVETGLLKEGMSIVVDGDKISAVVPTSDLDADVADGATVVDGSSWYALPGLVDSHTHLATIAERTRAEAYMRRYLYGGITTVRDMGGDIRSLADIKRASLVNEIEAPDVHYSVVFGGHTFFSDPRTVMSGLGEKPGYVPWMQGIDDNTNMPLAVAMAKGTYASGIKIYADVPSHLSRKIIEEANRQDFPVWTHSVVGPSGPLDAVEPGAKSISHACPLVFTKPMSYSEAMELGEPPFAAPDSPQAKEVYKALADSNTVFDATLQVYEEDEEGFCGTRADVAKYVTEALKFGAKVSAGTDAGSAPDDPFPALHQEIDNLVRLAGMSNAQALQAATLHSAMATGVDNVAGTIEAGKFANMIFLTKNPLDDVANLKSIVMTVKRGHQFNRDDYQHDTSPFEEEGPGGR